MKKIRYGIIGFGNFAEHRIAPSLAASANSTLVAIQKRSETEARRRADQLGIMNAYGRVEDLVASQDLDAVYITSANANHCRETVLAARAGKHVIVEKPMAMNAAESAEMIEVCRAEGVKLSVAHMTRYSPLLIRMRELVGSGVLGRIVAARADFTFDARFSPRTWILDPALAGAGPVFDVGVHCLDALRFVLDDEVVGVSSQLDPLPGPAQTEETAQLALRFSRGTIGSILCSFRTSFRNRIIELLGEKGSASAPDFTAPELTIPLTIVIGKDSGSSQATVEQIVVPNLYVTQISDFSDSILSGKDPILSGENGLKNQLVIDQAVKPRRAPL